MNNQFAAAIPLVIALLGANVPDTDSDSNDTRMRTAVTVSSTVTLEGLNDDQQAWLDEHNKFGIPKTNQTANRTLIVREGYTLAHNNIDLIADWVSYHLTKDYASGSEARPGSNAFKPDNLLKPGMRAELSDYKGWKGIYDRGHQVASGDSKGRGKRVIKESFYLSNMTPQNSKLNQHKWRLLEAKIQRYAKDRGELWVVTGPAFIDDDNDGIVEYSVIGDNEVAVPTHYFKIVISKQIDGNDFESMAFLIPNEPMKDDYAEFLVSIDEIENLTGYDFFSRMNDQKENAMEASVVDAIWE